MWTVFWRALRARSIKEQGIRELDLQRARSRTDRSQRDTPRLWAEAGRAKAVAQLCGFASRDKFKVTFPVT